jgi:hypothetical protein
VPEFRQVPPLDEALAALDTPEAVADRRKRAQKWAEQLEGRARGQMFMYASPAEMDSIHQPFRTNFYGTQTDTWRETAERAAGRAADAVVLKQCEIQLRARDLAEVYNDPDRQEAERVWGSYAKGVGAIAWAQGDRETAFIAKWRDLIAARRDAEQYDDAGAVRSIDARLLRLVGIPHPVLPGAAWDAADILPAAERAEEYARLEQKYGPRNPSTNGAGKIRSTRRLSAALTKAN